MIPRLIALGLLTFAQASTAGAAALHVPLHLPFADPAPSDATFNLGLDYFAVRAPGLNASGPGGFWEISSPINSRSAAHFKSGGSLLDGKIETVAGRRDTGGMVGSLEGDFSWKMRDDDHSPRVYVGALMDLTILDINDPALIQLGPGKTRVEPDTAFSIVFGVPVGLVAPISSSEKWKSWGQTGMVAMLGGTTLLSYSVAGPSAFGSSRSVNPQLVFDAALGASYAPWRLMLQVYGGASTSSGNNEGAVMGGASLAVRLF